LEQYFGDKVKIRKVSRA